TVLRRRAAAALVVTAVAHLPTLGDPLPATVPSEWRPFGLQGATVHSLAATDDLLCAGTQGSGVFCRQLDGSGTGTGWLSNGLAGARVTWLWTDPLNPLVRFAAWGAGG